MPVQNWSHGKSIRPLKVVSTLQSVPELPEDSDSIGMGASNRIPGEFPSDSLSSTDRSWIPYTARIQMLLELDDIPMWHNFLAIISSWLLLGGYMVLPGTFTSIRNSKAFNDGVGKVVSKAVINLPFLVIGGVCCLIGASSMLRLSWLWRKNHEWLLNRIIM